MPISIKSLVQMYAGDVLFAGLIGATVVFLALVFGSQAYTVQTDYLVIQKGAESQDFYTLSKSVEYSGNVLKEAVASDLFLSEVMNTNYFNRSVFSGDELDRLKKWRKVVRVSQRTNAGILEVTVRYSSRDDAMGIARAVSEVLINKNSLFRSGDADSISIKSISGPIVEQNPTISKLFSGIFSGFILGVAVLVAYILSRIRREEVRAKEQMKMKRERIREIQKESPFLEQSAA